MRPVRLALVGFGKWGQNYVKAAEDSGEARVEQVVPRNYLVEPAHCDAVVYAGHPRDAVARCEEALASRLPILVEKPAGLSLADAERIAALEREHKGLVLVGHQHLFAQGYEELRAMGPPASATAHFAGPVTRDYPFIWDYGPHAVSALLGLGAEVWGGVDGQHWYVAIRDRRIACVTANFGDGSISYDAYASQAEPPLTRQVRAFVRAVRAGGTDDWRFGARWAVDVAKALETASRSAAN